MALVDDLAELAELEDLVDDWEVWASRWEQEFQRLSALEDERLLRAAKQAQRLAALVGGASYQAAVEAAVEEGDRAAKVASAVSGELVAAQRAQAVASVAASAEQARMDAYRSAMQEGQDLLRQAMEGAMQRRLDNEAKRREERRARQQAEAKRQAGAQAKAAPARPQAAPATTGANEAAASSASVDAWASFERMLKQAEGPVLQPTDVPWPAAPPATVSGALSQDGPEERKAKLRAAVLRWHPDKWGRALPLFREEHMQKVLEQVKEVTRRILEERRRFLL